MSTKKITGICKLTGLIGPYVSSHLIPRALTRLSTTGEKTIQAGYGYGRSLKFEGWYDNKLVIRTGEDILAKIDSDAIKLMRSLKLIWSGWGDANFLNDEGFDLKLGQGFRALVIADHHCLQLFFLSLLWRAAVSTRPEFAEIALADSVLEDLRKRIVALDAGDYSDYPVILHQLGTRGPAHNRTPILEKHTFSDDESTQSEATYVRFYFEGLIAYVYLAKESALTDDMKRLCLGLGVTDKTLIAVHAFENSRAYENMAEIIRAYS